MAGPFCGTPLEVCAHGWTVLRDATHGAALLNDCKYGVSVNDGVISLSLLRAPTYPDASADRGRHRFVYAYRAWNGPLETSGVTEAAEALNDPLITVPVSMTPTGLRSALMAGPFCGTPPTAPRS